MTAERQENFIDQHSIKPLVKIEASPEVLSGAEQLFKSCGYLDHEGIENVSEALFFAHVAHRYFSKDPENATRNDKKEYTTHLVATAQILADLRCDQTTLTAGLLHDTLENTRATKEMLAARFGQEVADTVDTVTKVAGSTVDTMVKVLNGLVDRPRAVFIKLADRLHNMRTISFLPKEKRRKIADQTFKVFAPLARELGLYKMADELFDLSIGVKWEDQYQRAQRIIRKKYAKENSELLFAPIRSVLAEGAVINVLEPSVHSLFDFAQARAVVVDRDEIPVEIACRDENSFQETIAFFQQFYPSVRLIKEIKEGCLNLKLTIGERTFSLDIYNPAGYAVEKASIAALFQVADPFNADFDVQTGLARRKLEKPALLLQQIPQFGHEEVLKYFSEAIKYPLISVKTPIDEVIVLPAGSTALDYAFSISHDLGLKAKEAKINDKPAKLSQKLNGGDQVEIIEVGDHKWTVAVSMLDQVLYDGYRQVIRRALRLMLKDNRERLKKPGDRSKSYQKDLRIMHYTEDELRTAAEKIESDAENRGEIKLIDLFKKKTGKSLNIDLIRSWQPEIFSNPKHPKYNKDYKYFQKFPSIKEFLIACGLDEIDQPNLDKYIALLEEYETNLPVFGYDLPDKRAVLAMMAAITSTKANIVGVSLEYNLPDLPSGYVRLNLKVEIGGEIQQTLDHVLKQVVEGIKAESFKPAERQPEERVITIRLPEDINIFPFVALFTSFGLNIIKLDRSPGHAEFRVIEFKSGTMEADELELITQALVEIRKAIF